ncbi:MAG: protein kinase [Polyangiaceae bacterium]
MEASPATFRGTDRFALLDRVGEGGMGVVYRAHDRERDVVVALKTLTRASASAIYQLKKEFRGLADLVHPNVVQLYELVCADGHWFFTMGARRRRALRRRGARRRRRRRHRTGAGLGREIS